MKYFVILFVLSASLAHAQIDPPSSEWLDAAREGVKLSQGFERVVLLNNLDSVSDATFNEIILDTTVSYTYVDTLYGNFYLHDVATGEFDFVTDTNLVVRMVDLSKPWPLPEGNEKDDPIFQAPVSEISTWKIVARADDVDYAYEKRAKREKSGDGDEMASATKELESDLLKLLRKDTVNGKEVIFSYSAGQWGVLHADLSDLVRKDTINGKEVLSEFSDGEWNAYYDGRRATTKMSILGDRTYYTRPTYLTRLDYGWVSQPSVVYQSGFGGGFAGGVGFSIGFGLGFHNWNNCWGCAPIMNPCNTCYGYAGYGGATWWNGYTHVPINFGGGYYMNPVVINNYYDGGSGSGGGYYNGDIAQGGGHGGHQSTNQPIWKSLPEGDEVTDTNPAFKQGEVAGKARIDHDLPEPVVFRDTETASVDKTYDGFVDFAEAQQDERVSDDSGTERSYTPITNRFEEVMQGQSDDKRPVPSPASTSPNEVNRFEELTADRGADVPRESGNTTSDHSLAEVSVDRYGGIQSSPRTPSESGTAPGSDNRGGATYPARPANSNTTGSGRTTGDNTWADRGGMSRTRDETYSQQPVTPVQHGQGRYQRPSVRQPNPSVSRGNQGVQRSPGVSRPAQPSAPQQRAPVMRGQQPSRGHAMGQGSAPSRTPVIRQGGAPAQRGHYRR